MRKSLVGLVLTIEALGALAGAGRRCLVRFGHAPEPTLFVSDNANLLDIATMTTMRRLQA